MEPTFLLQIVTPSGDAVRFPAGGPIEVHLVEDIVQRVAARSVGVFRTRQQVADEVRVALTEALYAFKLQSVSAT